MNSCNVKTLLNNGSENFKKASAILIRIADNIIKYGAVEKYRSIRIDSKTFLENLLPFDGAVQCLFDMGFQKILQEKVCLRIISRYEDDDRFVFSDDSRIADLRKVRDELNSHLISKNSSPTLIASQNQIHERLKSHFRHSKFFENTVLQEKARYKIPVSSLEEQARQRFKRSDKSSYYHCLILELLAWFKKSFFTWTDIPNCTNCDADRKPISIGMLPPTPNELRWEAHRVEGYRCLACSTLLRFPRYNHPEKLLESRTGRCGEWANCFTLICRSMHFEARHVLDWTDHVWTEVFIPEWQRWVHCDPCENVCDTPLMYEQGWKKKLSLVVAASAEELVDVTWRYSIKRDDVKARRSSMFNEEWLVESIANLNLSLSIAIPPSRRRELERRRSDEREQMEQMKTLSAQECVGRTSGSLAWRLARGETQDGAEDCRSKMVESGTIMLTKSEVKSRLFQLEYCCCKNEYRRLSNNKETVAGWEEMTWRSRAVMRKEELDWKKVYLCRCEGSDEGYISWRVQVPSPHSIQQVSLNVSSSTFESGTVGWLLSSDKNCHVITSGRKYFFKSEYNGDTSLTLHCFLRGGSGENAFQKSQIFRESSEDESTPSMFIKIIIN